MEQQKAAYLHALLAVVFWSTAASAFKLTLDELDFLQMLLYSSFFSALILGAILLYQGKFELLKTYSKEDYLRSAGAGFLNPFLYYLVLFKAYSLLPAQEAQPLNFTWPVVLALLSIPLLKQKVKLQSVVALLISFSGVLIISTHGDVLGLGFTDGFGVFLAVGSAFIWASYWIVNVRDQRDEVAKLFLNFFFGFLFTIPVVLAFSSPSIDTPWQVIAGQEVSLLGFTFFLGLSFPASWGLAGAFYIGLFEMGITFVLWLKALKLSRTAAQVSNLIYGSPFLSLLLIYLIVKEEILASTVAGLVLIVVGILVQRQGEAREEKDLKKNEGEKGRPTA